MRLWPRYVDDRQEHARCDGFWIRRDPEGSAVEATRLDAAMRPFDRLLGRGAFAIGAAQCVVLILFPLALPRAHGWGFIAVAGTAATLVTLACYLVLRSRLIPLHRRGWLAPGRCPARGCAISDIEPEQDNCRVCPECGSAWRLEAGVSTGNA